MAFARQGKLGLSDEGTGDVEMIAALFDELEEHAVDFTSFFRVLARLLRRDGAMLESLLPAAGRCGSRGGGSGSRTRQRGS